MKVIFAIPAATGQLHMACAMSLMSAQQMLHMAGIEYGFVTICGCPNVFIARDTLVAMFLKDPDATDLFFIDSDVGFDASAILKLLSRDEEIVCGVYPLKREELGFPVDIKREGGVPTGKVIGENEALIEAEHVPGGFLRIKRSVFEKMRAEFPHMKYECIIGSERGEHIYFGIGTYEGRFRGEDYAFSQRWRDMGGQLWVYPNIDFEHAGMKAYKANLHEHLMRLPGGAKEGEN